MTGNINWNFYHKTLDKLGEENVVPGFAVAVVKNNEIVFSKGVGTTCHLDGNDIDSDTLFRVMSISKSMTGTMAMKLVDQGKLNLDTPIVEYVSWINTLENDLVKQVTLRSLLSHSMGLIEPEFAENGQHNVDDVELLSSERLENYVKSVLESAQFIFPPGNFFKYDNFEASLVGYLIQVVTGKPYVEVMQEEFFTPLGMTSTCYQTTENYAVGHTPIDEKTFEKDESMVDDNGHYPAVMVLTSINDLSKFLMLHLNKGKINGTQYISEEAITQMHEIDKDFNATSVKGFGFTFIVETHKGVKRSKNVGGGWGYLAEIILRPEDQLGLFYMTNLPSYPFQVFIKKMFDGIFEKLVSEKMKDNVIPAFTPDQSNWDKFTGTYISHENEFKILIQNKKLIVNNQEDTRELSAITESKYYVTYKNDDKKQESLVLTFVVENKQAEYLMVNVENKDGLTIGSGIFKRT